MRVIALEEHFFPEEVVYHGQIIPERSGMNYGRASEFGDARLADMDAAGVDVQVLQCQTWFPHDMADDAAESLRLAQLCNGVAKEMVDGNPDRFAAWATLPTSHPELAADELERAVTTLGARGAVLPGHVNGRFLDDQFYWPIFAKAESLGVPIYMHPRNPPQAVIDAYYSGFSPEVNVALASGAWGWHCETGLHALRLIVSGLFDRYPELQIVIGHLGENVPYSLDRAAWMLDGLAGKLERGVAEYFRQNFYLTTSGYFSDAPLVCAISVVGADRIMFAVDYPFADSATAVSWLANAPISDGDREKIAHGNAERLLRLAETTAV